MLPNESIRSEALKRNWMTQRPYELKTWGLPIEGISESHLSLVWKGPREQGTWAAIGQHFRLLLLMIGSPGIETEDRRPDSRDHRFIDPLLLGQFVVGSWQLGAAFEFQFIWFVQVFCMLIDFAVFSSIFYFYYIFLFIFQLEDFLYQANSNGCTQKDYGQRTEDKGQRQWVNILTLGFHSWLNCSAIALLIDLFELWFGCPLLVMANEHLTRFPIPFP